MNTVTMNWSGLVLAIAVLMSVWFWTTHDKETPQHDTTNIELSVADCMNAKQLSSFSSSTFIPFSLQDKCETIIKSKLNDMSSVYNAQ